MQSGMLLFKKKKRLPNKKKTRSHLRSAEGVGRKIRIGWGKEYRETIISQGKDYGVQALNECRLYMFPDAKNKTVNK